MRKISRYRKFIQIAISLCETTQIINLEGQAPYYTQCVADPTTYSTLPDCISNYGAKCSSTTSCCDPGAYCDLTKGITQCYIVYYSCRSQISLFTGYPQCHQPLPGSNICSDPKGFSPSLQPITSRPSLYLLFFPLVSQASHRLLCRQQIPLPLLSNLLLLQLIYLLQLRQLYPQQSLLIDRQQSLLHLNQQLPFQR